MVKEVTQGAKKALKGKWLLSMGVIVLYFVLGELLMLNVDGMGGFTFMIGLSYLLLFPLAFGLNYFFLNLARGKEKLEDLLEFYYDFKTGLKLILGTFWYMIIIVIGCILFIVPGIIWSFRYAMFMLLIMDDRSLSIQDAMKQSAEMMKGYKWLYFWTTFRVFIIPYILLVVFTVLTSFSTFSTFSFTDNEHVKPYSETYLHEMNRWKICFDTLKPGTVKIDENEETFTATISKDQDFEEPAFNYYFDEDEEYGSYLSVFAKDGSYTIIEDENNYIVTVNKVDSDDTLDDVFELANTIEPIEPGSIEETPEFDELVVQTGNNEKANIMFLVISLVGLILSIIWFVSVLPLIELIQLQFYVVLKDKKSE